MKTTIVLIDGENFLYKVKDITKSKLVKRYQLKELIKQTLNKYRQYEIVEIQYYAAKLKAFKKTIEKSLELIDAQRVFKTDLEKQGIKYKFSGYVRPQGTEKTGYIFKEKGVDVAIAVDIVSYACDKKYDCIVMCSSDSDLQPAVKEAKRRGVEIIYLGFQRQPNRGLRVTTNKTILFKDKDIVKYSNEK